MTRRQSLGATVSIIQCSSCGKRSPILTLVADTDMSTSGLECLSSGERNEVAIAKEGARIEREDLKPVLLLRADAQTDVAGLDFPTFRREFKPPILIYTCPRCGIGEARVSEEMSLHQFRQSGGTVTILTDVRLDG